MKNPNIIKVRLVQSIKYTRFFINILQKNDPQKIKNLKKMLGKFPASNALVAILKNANFSQGSFKVTKLSEF